MQIRGSKRGDKRSTWLFGYRLEKATWLHHQSMLVDNYIVGKCRRGLNQANLVKNTYEREGALSLISGISDMGLSLISD